MNTAVPTPDDVAAAPASPAGLVVVPASGVRVSASLARPRASIALESSHQRRVRNAERAYDAARAGGDPAAVAEAMATLDDARMGARLWRR